MKKLILVANITILWFLMAVTVYAWEVPSYLRANGGVRMWFTNIEGDLIQLDRNQDWPWRKHGTQKREISLGIFCFHEV